MPALQGYLDRIGFPGRPRVDFESLRLLHRQHLLTIPYENLDVQLGRPVGFDIDAIYDKLVARRRGGWCYEMNGLLAWALETIGFSITRLAAGVLRAHRGDAAVGNHLAICVELPGSEVAYLADVGFGDGALEPVALTPGPFQQRGFDFVLEPLTDGWWRFHNHPHGGAASFDFQRAPADPQVLAQQCQLLQTAPESPFTQLVIAQRHVAGGLAALRGRILTEVQPGALYRRELVDARDFGGVLRDVFDIDEPAAQGLWPRVVESHARFLAARPDPGGAPAPRAS